MIKSLLQKIICMFANTYADMRSYIELPLRLEELDVEQNVAVIRSRGMRTVLRLSLMDAIADPLIIDNLPPIQACWLGYHASQFEADLSNIQTSLMTQRKQKNFRLKFNRGCYKILAQNRDGTVEYLDIKSKSVHVMKPSIMVRHNALISNFDSSQACYIGVLAGIEQAQSRSVIKQKRVSLQIVK